MKKKPRGLHTFLMVLVILSWFALPALAVDYSEVEKSFVSFQQEWIKKLNKHGKYGEKNTEVEEDANLKGGYVARYCILGEPKSYEIKKTDQKATPYVGIMRYEKMIYSCKGPSGDTASKGPFKFEKRVNVTEIFRYSNGKWVY